MNNVFRYSFSLWQKILERRLRRRGKGGIVLMFHEVYADGEAPRDLRFAVSAGDFGVPVPDYLDENVSGKVVRIIQGFTGVVDKMVWRKE